MDSRKKTFTTAEISQKSGISLQIFSRWINRSRSHFSLRTDQFVTLDDYIAFVEDQEFEAPIHPCTKPCVLIVDDEENIVSSIGRVFQSNGFDTICASNGFSAAVLLKQNRPQLITIDLSMNGLDGYDVLDIIHRLKLDTKAWVIIISGNPKDHCERAIEMGADFYLKKPFSKTDLEKIINRIFPKSA